LSSGTSVVVYFSLSARSNWAPHHSKPAAASMDWRRRWLSSNGAVSWCLLARFYLMLKVADCRRWAVFGRYTLCLSLTFRFTP